MSKPAVSVSYMSLWLLGTVGLNSIEYAASVVPVGIKISIRLLFCIARTMTTYSNASSNSFVSNTNLKFCSSSLGKLLKYAVLSSKIELLLVWYPP